MITLTSYIYSQNQYNQYIMHPLIPIEFFFSSSLFLSPFISSYFLNMVKRVLGSLDLSYIQQICIVHCKVTKCTASCGLFFLFYFFLLSNNLNPIYITRQGSPAVMKEYWFIFQVRLSYMLLRTIWRRRWGRDPTPHSSCCCWLMGNLRMMPLLQPTGWRMPA